MYIGKDIDGAKWKEFGVSAFWTVILPALICIVLCLVLRVMWYVIIIAAVGYYVLLVFFRVSKKDPDSVFGPQLKWFRKKADETGKVVKEDLNKLQAKMDAHDKEL